MPDIFLSWGGPDEAPVMELKEVLNALGFGIWEYRESTAVGTTTHKNVLQAIHEATVAVLCFSDQTANRQWIEDEAEWAYAAYKGDVTRLLPVWVGKHPKDLKPRRVEKEDLVVADLYGNNHQFALATLKKNLAAILRAQPPVDVPALMFAMDEQQSLTLCAELKANGARANALSSLSLMFGMAQPPPLLDSWQQRYRARREDFSPYSADTPMTKIVEKAVNGANTSRTRKGKPPINLLWIHDQIAKRHHDKKAAKEAREWFGASRPLMIIDSISTLCPAIQQEIGNLPDFGHASVLWIPPFTQQTEQAEAWLRESVDEIGRISDVFGRWEHLKAQGAFESASSLSARLWMQSMLVSTDEPGERQALEENVTYIQREQPAFPSINAAMGGPDRE